MLRYTVEPSDYGIWASVQGSMVSGHDPVSNSKARTQYRTSHQIASSFNSTSDKSNTAFLGVCFLIKKKP